MRGGAASEDWRELSRFEAEADLLDPLLAGVEGRGSDREGRETTAEPAIWVLPE